MTEWEFKGSAGQILKLADCPWWRVVTGADCLWWQVVTRGGLSPGQIVCGGGLSLVAGCLGASCHPGRVVTGGRLSQGGVSPGQVVSGRNVPPP